MQQRDSYDISVCEGCMPSLKWQLGLINLHVLQGLAVFSSGSLLQAHSHWVLAQLHHPHAAHKGAMSNQTPLQQTHYFMPEGAGRVAWHASCYHRQ